MNVTAASSLSQWRNFGLTNLQFPCKSFWCTSAIIAIDRTTTEQLYLVDSCSCCVCMTAYTRVFLWPDSLILPAPPWTPGSLLAPGLFWVRWFVSKREALMPQCCVYFSLSILDMASLYPDAGISWACVCLCLRLCVHRRKRPCVCVHVPFPMPPRCQDSHATITPLWWVYQMGISYQPPESLLLLPLHLLHTLSTSRSYLYRCLA